MKCDYGQDEGNNEKVWYNSTWEIYIGWKGVCHSLINVNILQFTGGRNWNQVLTRIYIYI